MIACNFGGCGTNLSLAVKLPCIITGHLLSAFEVKATACSSCSTVLWACAFRTANFLVGGHNITQKCYTIVISSTPTQWPRWLFGRQHQNTCWHGLLPKGLVDASLRAGTSKHARPYLHSNIRVQQTYSQSYLWSIAVMRPTLVLQCLDCVPLATRRRRLTCEWGTAMALTAPASGSSFRVWHNLHGNFQVIPGR